MNDAVITHLPLSEHAPYVGNGIYLEQNDKQTIAVCANEQVAAEIADILTERFQVPEKDLQTAALYKKIIIGCYYMLKAIDKCNICINSISTQLLAYSHDEMYSLLQQLFELHPELLRSITESQAAHDQAPKVNCLSRT